MLLKSAKKALRSKHLHPLLHPLTYLVPIFSILSGAIAAFNSYALSYAGMTGEPYTSSGREVVKMLRANETGSLGDSELSCITRGESQADLISWQTSSFGSFSSSLQSAGVCSLDSSPF